MRHPFEASPASGAGVAASPLDARSAALESGIVIRCRRPWDARVPVTAGWLNRTPNLTRVTCE
jgi:hypothetical protein